MGRLKATPPTVPFSSWVLPWGLFLVLAPDRIDGFDLRFCSWPWYWLLSIPGRRPFDFFARMRLRASAPRLGDQQPAAATVRSTTLPSTLWFFGTPVFVSDLHEDR